MKSAKGTTQHTGTGPVAITLAWRSRVAVPRTTHGRLPEAITDPTDGHPHVVTVKDIDLDNVYNIPNISIDSLPSLTEHVTAYYPEISPSEVGIDWTRVTTNRGVKSYTIDELKEKILEKYIDLPAKTKTKQDYVDFMIANKKLLR